MADDLPVNANIAEIDNGAYYRVKLDFIPRVGEHIELYSHLDAADGHNARHNYEVVSVVHQVSDVTEKNPRSLKGYQYVTINVKPVPLGE